MKEVLPLALGAVFAVIIFLLHFTLGINYWLLAILLFPLLFICHMSFVIYYNIKSYNLWPLKALYRSFVNDSKSYGKPIAEQYREGRYNDLLSNAEGR